MAASEVSSETMTNQQEETRLELPPGFRFHPTDEEVVSHYLTHKALDSRFSCLVIADVDLNKIEPWDLPSKAKMGEKEWYFFCHKDRKYPTGMRTNRATASGYWKATGKDKEIFRGAHRDRVLVGMKKTLVFYTGRAPNGGKTPWVMHEYRLEGTLPSNLRRAAKDEWAVCKVFNKDLAAKAGQMAPPHAVGVSGSGMVRSDSLAFLDDLVFDNVDLPPLIDSPYADAGSLVAGGASSSSFAAAGTNGSRYQQGVKAEQQLPAPASNYSPAAGGSYPYDAYSYQAQQQAGGEPQQQAIRRHCKAEAPATTLLSPSRGGEAPGADMFHVDDLLQLDGGFVDYSNDMWKF